MQSLGIHHASIMVSDTAAALDFYVNTLGMVQRADRPDFGFPGAWLDCGAAQLHLIEGEVPTHCGQHFALHVADLDAVVAELRAGGVEVPDPRPVGSGRQTFVSDPSGNLVELHQAVA